MITTFSKPANPKSKNRTITIYYDDECMAIKSLTSMKYLRPKMIMWCLHNCESKFQTHIDNFYFKSKNDAVAFKIIFGGE